jgi:hypothetical protein
MDGLHIQTLKSRPLNHRYVGGLHIGLKSRRGGSLIVRISALRINKTAASFAVTTILGKQLDQESL